MQALRGAWPEVSESADFVMCWWARAVALVSAGRVERMGLITTNSLRQTFNRRVVQLALDGALGSVGGGVGMAEGLILSKARKSTPSHTHPSAGAAVVAPSAAKPVAVPISLVFAIPDHPWVDSANGAAVRIAMTVGVRDGGAANFGSEFGVRSRFRTATTPEYETSNEIGL